MSSIPIESLREWIGRERIREDDLAPFKARALAAALDRSVNLEAGTVLPPAWQWMYFVDTPRASETGTDGHPQKGGFLPPVPLGRRMWAAGKFVRERPLYLGVPAEQRSVIQSVDLKEGKSGTLVFVTVEHHTSQKGQRCLYEEQNIVYREMPTAHTPLPTGEAPPENPDWQMDVTPDPVLLFRFSALTYNGHRIHYDRDYAVNQEFYPSLVVQGPLLATLLAELVAINVPEADIGTFQFRAKRPTFDMAPFTLCGKRVGEQAKLWTVTPDGYVGMSAEAMLEVKRE